MLIYNMARSTGSLGLKKIESTTGQKHERSLASHWPKNKIREALQSRRLHDNQTHYVKLIDIKLDPIEN